jgi:threonylcarbamoyladenosine tRNA methylthiotransferase MtaB
MIQKRFYIKTLGCKVNQYESQVIRENFIKNGHIETNNSNEADICVVNTCTVTATSDAKSLKSIRSSLRKKDKYVIATGCMIEAEDLDLRKLKGVDFIIKNKDKYNIPSIINNRIMPHVSSGIGHELRGISGFEGHARAFVKVQDGCNNICSYCKVNIVRGKSTSKPLKEVFDECNALIKNGYKEIVLAGICLGSYGRDISKDIGLSKLIMELGKIKGDWRMRLSSIEPKDVTDELVAQIKSEEKLCKHLHLPFQSGDDEVLKRMNRPYSVVDYIDIVTTLRKAIPDIAISTDIMVGFPGEKEANFQNTLDFIKEVRPMRTHVFGFSKRIGTPAYNYKDNIDNRQKKQRECVLIDLASRFSREFEGAFIGKIVRVLVENRRDNHGFLHGYTDRYIKVLIDGPDDVKFRLLTCQLSLTNQKVCGILLPYLD